MIARGSRKRKYGNEVPDLVKYFDEDANISEASKTLHQPLI